MQSNATINNSKEKVEEKKCVSSCPEVWDTRPLVYGNLCKKAQTLTEIIQLLHLRGLLKVVE